MIPKKSDCKTKKKSEIKGCTNDKALNYDPTATKNDGSCKYNKKSALSTCPFDHEKYNCKKKVRTLNTTRKKLAAVKVANKLNIRLAEITEIQKVIDSICEEIENWKGIIKNGSCICNKKDEQIKKLNKSKCN